MKLTLMQRYFVPAQSLTPPCDPCREVWNIGALPVAAVASYQDENGHAIDLCGKCEAKLVPDWAEQYDRLFNGWRGVQPPPKPPEVRA